MSKIFLSASVPTPGREYFEGSNPLLIREAIVAFTRVCMEYKIPFYFGGHPAVSPLVYQIAKNYVGKEDAPIAIYQSEWFKKKTPDVVRYYHNIHWTTKGEDCKESIKNMRKQMFEENKDTCCAVFIGGMGGIIEEAERVKALYPSIDLLPVASTGCAAADVYKSEGLNNYDLSSNYVYLLAFRHLLAKYRG